MANLEIRADKKVRCNMCYTIYLSDDDLNFSFRDEDDGLTWQEDENGYFWGCSKCKTDDYLMDLGEE